ncbi:hypothetical protein ZWY2020_057944 [Hordeum vulgare]|nr:hypothetical protein ZWY2020_057944 [Hordeum vulgare]
MISGGGRPHGSIAIGDGIIRCPLTLPEIKARQSSNCPEITRRPRPVELAIEAALEKRAANQAALEKERLASQAALQAALDERDQSTARLLEEERARNEAGQRALYELFVNNSRAASHDPSPGQPLQTKPARATVVFLLLDDHYGNLAQKRHKEEEEEEEAKANLASQPPECHREGVEVPHDGPEGPEKVHTEDEVETAEVNAGTANGKVFAPDGDGNVAGESMTLEAVTVGHRDPKALPARGRNS